MISRPSLLLLAALLAAVLRQNAPAAIVTYDIFIGGYDWVGSSFVIKGDNASVQTLPPGQHHLIVAVKVTDNELLPGIPGGLLQSAFNLEDTNNRIRWEDLAAGFLGDPNGNGLWDSDIPQPGIYTIQPFDFHRSGVLTDDETNVVAETAAIAPGSSTSKFNSAGADVWTVVAMGNFELRPGATRLLLDVVNPYGGDILVTDLKPGDTFISAAIPDLVIEDSIWINVPEPAAASMVCLGALTVIGRRQRLRSPKAK